MAPGVFSHCYFLTAVLVFSSVHNSGSLDLTLGFTKLSAREVVAHRNAPLLLNCSGFSSPGHGILKTTWLYQGGEINDENHKVFSNGSLHIAKLQHPKRHSKEDGSYFCVLHNSVGTIISRPINVIIPRIARNFSTQPESVTLMIGGVTRFLCQINSVPPAIISWNFNGVQLPRNSRRHFFPSPGILQILSVTGSDTGEYFCTATNGARQRHSNKASLVVEDAPKKFQAPQFLTSSSQYVAIENSSIFLECLASGYPTPRISWEKKGDTLPHQKWSAESQGNLVIHSLAKSDGGIYLCTASSQDPQSGKVYNITQQSTLIVQVPPTFSEKPLSQIKPTAQTARLNCSSEGSPPPHIQWLKNAKPLYINGRIKQKIGNILVISQIVSSDSGIYQCIASNAAGSVRTAARLQVTSSNNQPNPPTNLRAHTVSSSSILLTWNPAISPNDLSIQAYTVHYVPTAGGMELQNVAVNTSQVITKLKPYTNYTVYVRAYNGKSASEQSESVVQVTGEDVPIGVPVVTLSSLSTTTLRVLWTEMSDKLTRGIVTGYRIHYRRHNQASYNVIEVAGTIREYTITGLQPTKKYDVRVMGGTKAGFPSLPESVWSWETYEMPNVVTAKVPMTPILHLTVVNTTTLKVSWTMPNENIHPVEGYKLFFREQSRPLQGPITLSFNTTSFLLSELEPQTWYEVHVLGYSKHGEGEEAVRNILTLSQDNVDDETFEVVEPPQNLEAEPTSPSCVHLQWTVPTASKNNSYYTIRYGPVYPKGTESNSSSYYIRSTDREVEVIDLLPFTLYEFSVRSHIDNLQGPFSQKVECKTKEDVPSVPLDLQWSPVDATSVRLTWQPPVNPNGVIVMYYIFYNTHVEDKNWLTKEEDGSQQMSIVTGLLSNTLYYFCLRAATTAGIGPQSLPIVLTIPVRNIMPTSQPTSEDNLQDPFLGIVVGISIGVTCMVICTIIVLSRTRLCRSYGQTCANCCRKRRVTQMNGHAFREAPKMCSLDNETVQEMECYTPMLTSVGSPEGSNHLDTKGGYPSTCNHGPMRNGLHPLDGSCPLRNGINHKLSNGRSAQGHHSPVVHYGLKWNGNLPLMAGDETANSVCEECSFLPMDTHVEEHDDSTNEGSRLAPELLAATTSPCHYQEVPDVVVNSGCVPTETDGRCNGLPSNTAIDTICRAT